LLEIGIGDILVILSFVLGLLKVKIGFLIDNIKHMSLAFYNIRLKAAVDKLDTTQHKKI
jgi:hypothetical protein